MAASWIWLVGSALAGNLAPREPLVVGPIVVPPLPADAPAAAHQLSLKLRDPVLGRLDRLGLPWSASGADLSGLVDVSARFGVRFEPLLELPAERLLDLERRAATRSGRAQPDLQGFWRVVFDGAPDAARLQEVGEALQRLDVVEYAHVSLVGLAPPGDLGTTTPDYTAQQTWLNANPGIDVGAAWLRGATGAGIRVSDVEYGWVYGHEDLMDRALNPEPGQTIPSWVVSLGYDEHGTAAFGEVAAVHNAYGCDGGVPDAALGTYPEWSDQQGPRRPTAMASALADSVAGDVIMLEMQDFGAGGGYAPAEVNPDVWAMSRTASDAGVIVVGAAGNGTQDLDSAAYAPYRAWGDSGALLVGAGTGDLRHDMAWFSTYGARVNVQGWGDWRVFTLGYGSYTAIDGQREQRYADDFSGTSSATPMVTTAVALIQSFVKDAGSAPLTPMAIRSLLVSTGVPQGSGGHIGPLPDLEAALDALDADGDGLIGEAFGGNDCDDADPRAGRCLTIAMTGTCPGPMTLHVERAAADSELCLVTGATAVPSRLPANNACVAGRPTVGVGGIHLVRKVQGGDDGTFDLAGNLGGGCTDLLQVIDLTTGAASPVTPIP